LPRGAGFEHKVVFHPVFGPVGSTVRGLELAMRCLGCFCGSCRPAVFHNRCARSQRIS
jgi:hypothetical protein